MESNFKETCRVCLVYSENLLSLFDVTSNTILLKWESITNKNIIESINWPQQICSTCTTKLDELFIFREQLLQNESILIEKYGPLQIKEENKLDSNIDQDLQESASSELKDECESQEEDDEEEETNDNDDVVENESEDTEDEEYSPTKPRPKVSSERRERKDAESKKIKLINQTIADFMKLTCVLCPEEKQHEEFKDFLQLGRHFTRVHKTHGYVRCCNNSFKRRYNLYEHVLHHNDPNRFKCPLCEKQFISALRLKEHNNVHLSDDQKKFTCPKCGKKLATKLKYNNHMFVHVPEEEKQFKCEDCEKKFPAKHALAAHVRIVHQNIRPYVCEFCSKGFLSEKALKGHIVSQHTENQPKIKCDHCNKLYSNERTLMKHMKNVMGPREHKCQLCDHVAPTRSSLNGHVLYKHVNGQAFACSICDRRFKVKKNLQEHIAGHTGVKLYKCLFCPKEFNSNANKYSHQKKKHPAEWEENNRKQFAMDC